MGGGWTECARHIYTFGKLFMLKITLVHERAKFSFEIVPNFPNFSYFPHIFPIFAGPKPPKGSFNLIFRCFEILF